MNDEWLSLSEVAKMLGVHPSTVRSWSDQGHLPAHRTQGGHRRFRRRDIELWIQTHREEGLDEGNLVIQAALKNIRVKVSEGNLANEAWYEKLDEEARNQYRRSGRALLQGLLESLAVHGEYDDSEARSLGFEYASRGWRRGLTAAEASRAFLFFRNVLLDAMLTVYEESSIQTPRAWSDIFRQIYHFTDQIQITLLETYDAYQRGNH
ncbi:MAG: helix-turn-helix domain-containing protein [Chloroflexota bacterium]|nr:MAG: helix-turn-helix domain-containing protein [Chloroflexota bacterium]